MNGTLSPSETFAIDWVQVDDHGLAYRTDGKKPQDWYDYGVEILAVAPGTVVEVINDLPDVVPGKNPEGLTMIPPINSLKLGCLAAGNFPRIGRVVCWESSPARTAGLYPSEQAYCCRTSLM